MTEFPSLKGYYERMKFKRLPFGYAIMKDDTLIEGYRYSEKGFTEGLYYFRKSQQLENDNKYYKGEVSRLKKKVNRLIKKLNDTKGRENYYYKNYYRENKNLQELETKLKSTTRRKKNLQYCLDKALDEIKAKDDRIVEQIEKLKPKEYHPVEKKNTYTADDLIVVNGGGSVEKKEEKE